MKKFLSALLALAMVLCLAGCGNADVEKKIVGSWVAEINGGDYLEDNIEDSEIEELMGLNSVTFTYCVELNEDKSCSLHYDSEELSKWVDEFKPKFYNYLKDAVVDELNEACEAEGINIEEAYATYGVEDTDGLLDVLVGEDFDNYVNEGIEEIRKNMDAYIEGAAFTGTYKVIGKQIVIYQEDEAVQTGTYDAETDTFILDGDEDTLTFNRK